MKVVMPTGLGRDCDENLQMVLVRACKRIEASGDGIGHRHPARYYFFRPDLSGGDHLDDAGADGDR
ncbi:MAG: hypothetical protein J0H31_20470, partial [Alphaproteobacteria bacterium]|nr:hypothetical protein [Alphaproteobacteria bacterium]